MQTWVNNAVVYWGSPYLGVQGPCSAILPGYDNTTSPSLSNTSSVYSYGGNGKIVDGFQYSNDTIQAVGGSPIPNIQFALEDYGLIRQNADVCGTSIEVDLGILGLSPFSSIANVPSFRENLYTTGAIAARTMVMWFDQYVGAYGTVSGGTLFGAIDKSKFSGPLVRVPNDIQDGQIGFYVAKPAISFNGQALNASYDTNCLVDSGTHEDVLPFPYYGDVDGELFYTQTGLIYQNGATAYNGTCDSMPQDLSFTYTFAGVAANESVSIEVPLRNYVRGAVVTDPDYTGPEICVLNIDTIGCVLGAPFSTAVFLAVDDKDGSIAFAQGGVGEAGLDEGSLVVIGEGESWDSV